MFYEQLIKICKINNVKPSPVLKELGLSSGNLKRWESGASVNYDTLEKLATYFDVPVDYFFADDSAPNAINGIEEGYSFKAIYNVLKVHPDYIASMISETSISSDKLLKISEYLNCSPDYLVKNSIIDDKKPSDEVNISAKDIILGILSKLPAGEEYRFLQVRISSIIIFNLAKKNITADKLIAIDLAEKKIRDLCDMAIPAENKKGLNFSDLVRIMEAFNISFDFMLTGNDH